MIVTSSAPIVQRRDPQFAEPVPERYRRELIERACLGDSIAFARLYDFYAERVYAYMHFHVADKRATEDLTARVFLKAWRNIRCFDDDRSPFSVWLYLIARNAMLEYGRTHRDQVLVKEIIAPADEGLDAFEPFETCAEEHTSGQDIGHG
jgi:RNA polymerase sigma factor (sigma-70 family)